jgi:pimeloyl-ACP methyl ester carboxylesterase
MVDGLVLCSPPVFPEHRIPWFFRLLRAPLLGDMLAPVVVTLLWRLGFRNSVRRKERCPDELIAAFRQPFLGYRGWRWFVHVLRWGDPRVVLARTAALLPDITARTLILHGRRDGTIPVSFATRAAQLIPNASVQILEGGHFVPLTCSEDVASHLLAFLRTETTPAGEPARERAG